MRGRRWSADGHEGFSPVSDMVNGAGGANTASSCQYTIYPFTRHTSSCLKISSSRRVSTPWGIRHKKKLACFVPSVGARSSWLVAIEGSVSTATLADDGRRVRVRSGNPEAARRKHRESPSSEVLRAQSRSNGYQGLRGKEGFVAAVKPGPASVNQLPTPERELLIAIGHCLFSQSSVAATGR